MVFGSRLAWMSEVKDSFVDISTADVESQACGCGCGLVDGVRDYGLVWP